MDAKTELGLQIYRQLIDRLTEMRLKFKTDEEKHRVDFVITGKDLAMHMYMYVDMDRQIITVQCPQSFHFKEEQIFDAAKVICAVNYRLVNGCFDLNVKNGQVVFRVSTAFMDSTISSKVFDYLLSICIHTVDDYNDKLYMLANGMLEAEELLGHINA